LSRNWSRLLLHISGPRPEFMLSSKGANAMMPRSSWIALLGVSTFLLSQSLANAKVYNIAISPPASQALNLGTTTYPGDHFLGGLSALNESHQPASTATGGAMSQMTFDDVTKLLTVDYAYGSAFGFTDLQGNWTDTHIHGNGTDTAHFPALNTNAGVTIGLASFHVPSGPRSGRVTTAVALNANQEMWLFNNQLYFNVHSQFSGQGEVRGQIVVIPEPATIGLAGLAGLALLASRRQRA
jgi:hypothetical protein